VYEKVLYSWPNTIPPFIHPSIHSSTMVYLVSAGSQWLVNCLLRSCCMHSTKSHSTSNFFYSQVNLLTLIFHFPLLSCGSTNPINSKPISLTNVQRSYVYGCPILNGFFMAALHNSSCELKSTSMMRESQFNPINPECAEILSIQSALQGSRLFFLYFSISCCN